MLKIVSLFLITLGLVSATTKGLTVEQTWEQVPRSLNGSQCIYISSLMKFSCRGIEEIIDCDAVRHLSGVSTRFFGLGRVPVVKGESARYWLYPRIENTTTYLNHTWNFINKTTESPVNTLLYQGDKFINFGIRVPDLKCYQRIVKFLDTITVEQFVELESDLVVRPTVGLIGEVLIVDPTMTKRNLGPLGLLALLSLSSPFGFGFLG